MIRPVKTVDRDTLDLIRLLREIKAGGGRKDYFNYEDVGG